MTEERVYKYGDVLEWDLESMGVVRWFVICRDGWSYLAYGLHNDYEDWFVGRVQHIAPWNVKTEIRVVSDG